MTDRESDNRLEERLRETLQPVPLSDRQRRRHRERLAGAGVRPRKSGRLEFAVVAVALIVVLATVALWSALGAENGEDDDDGFSAAQPPPATPTFEMESLGMSEETFEPEPPPFETMPGLHMETTPPPIAAMCAASTTAKPPKAAPVSMNFPDWYGDPASGLWVAPADLSVARASVAQMTGSGVAWYAGAPSVIQVYGTLDPLMIRGERGAGGETFEVQPETQPDEASSSQRASFTIPSPGCWTLTISDGQRELSIALDVFPREMRPDLIFLEQVSAIRPFDPPATCAATPLTGPEMRGDAIVFRYWMEHGGIAVDVEHGWYTAGRAEPLNIVGEGVDGATRVSARFLGEGAREVVPERQETTDHGQFAVMIFPEPGCWELIVESPSESAIFTTYVYPEECVPNENLDGVPAACAAPRSSLKSVTGAGFEA